MCDDDDDWEDKRVSLRLCRILGKEVGEPTVVLGVVACA